MKGADIITNILIAKGVDTIFGYPGGYILDIYNSLCAHSSLISLRSLNSEQACVFAADGYARVSGRLGVVLATSGPGACNLITGIASANADSVPLLAITGNVPTYKLGSDSFQEVDILGVTMPITKYNQIVKTIEELPRKLIEVIDIATSGRKGATLIDIPKDIQTMELDITKDDIINLCKPKNIPAKPVDNNAITRAVELINASSKVTLLIGGGCNSIADESLANSLARLLSAPVATTLMGINHYDNSEPNFLGLSGSFGSPCANHAIKVCDTLITLGARFGDRLIASASFDKKRIIQIDIDNAEHDKNIDAVCFLSGQISDILPRIIPLLEPKPTTFLTSMLAYRLKVGAGDNDRSTRNMLHSLADFVGKEAIVATDVGEHQMSTARNYHFGRAFLTSSGLGAMGYGLPAIIGANIATTPKKSLLISGDGSINMSLVELASVAKMNLPLLIVIFNNHTLGMCKTTQIEQYGKAYMTDTPTNIDYVKVANAFGIDATRVSDTKSLGKVLKEYSFNKPLIIDIIMDN